MVPVACVKQRGVKTETRSAYLTKRQTAAKDQFRERKARVPTADGSFIVMAGGDESKKRDERPQKSWRHGWTVTHVPL